MNRDPNYSITISIGTSTCLDLWEFSNWEKELFILENVIIIFSSFERDTPDEFVEGPLITCKLSNSLGPIPRSALSFIIVIRSECKSV